MELFGEGRKELHLVERCGGYGWCRPLWFASKEDYKLAEKNIGMAVRVTLIVAEHGDDEIHLVERLELAR